MLSCGPVISHFDLTTFSLLETFFSMRSRSKTLTPALKHPDSLEDRLVGKRVLGGCLFGDSKIEFCYSGLGPGPSKPTTADGSTSNQLGHDVSRLLSKFHSSSILRRSSRLLMIPHIHYTSTSSIIPALEAWRAVLRNRTKAKLNWRTRRCSTPISRRMCVHKSLTLYMNRDNQHDLPGRTQHGVAALDAG